MSPRIPDLWSDDISPEVLTPLAILRAQIPGLERRTKGLLEAEINSVKTDKQSTHNFDLVAPALNNYRERILIATHDPNRVYPVTVQAACFTRKSGPGAVAGDPLGYKAMSQEEFLDLVAEVLRSPEVRSSIQSLIARSNEMSTSSPNVADPGATEGKEAPLLSSQRKGDTSDS